MRHYVFFFMCMMMAAVWGCRDFVDASDSGNGGNGEGGTVTTTTTTTGNGGEGGEGGSEPGFVFDCSDVPDSTLVVKLDVPIVPVVSGNHFLGIDGACTGDADWKGRAVTADDGEKRLVWTYGEVYPGAECDMHVGIGDGELFTNLIGEQIYNRVSLCSDNSCVNEETMLCCYGGKALPLTWPDGQSDHDRKCLAE